MLSIVLCIPYSRCGILGQAGLSGIDEKLLRSGMGAHESSELSCAQSLISEEADDLVRAVKDAWDKAGWGWC